jgi:hypothetical protein
MAVSKKCIKYICPSSSTGVRVSDHGILDKTMLGKLLVAKIALHECKLLL